MSAAALITDLFFVTRVKGTADALGVPLSVTRTVEGLIAAASGAGLVIVDLNATGTDPVEAIRAVKALADTPPVVAYLSHVQTELAQQAREVGADLVLPRSAFTARLPELLQKAAGPS